MNINMDINMDINMNINNIDINNIDINNIDNINCKIALCFLTYGNLSQPKLWTKMINNTNNVNVYIHPKSNFVCNDTNLHQYIIKNKVPTVYARISIVRATLALFKEAYQNQQNKFFVLLSDTCIPLFPLDIIYKKIVELNSNIITKYRVDTHKHRRNAFTQKDYIKDEDFYSQSQWMCLTRDTVKFFLDNDFTYIFGERFEVPDEHYFVNLCIKFNISFINKDITFVNWNEKSKSQKYRDLPKTYDIVTQEMLDICRNSGFMFMRKISKDCVLPEIS